MMMNDTVARIVEIMFQDVEMNEETSAIRDEVMNNCQDRYTDLVASGMAEDDAIAAVIESLKGMEDVLAPYKKKAQHVDLEDDEEESASEQHVTFAADMVHKINVSLVNEDVNIEDSDDEDYHVTWNADGCPKLKVELQDGELRIVRAAGEQPKAEKVRTEIPKEDIADFIKTEGGKIEINMDSIGRAMKSLGEKIKMQFADGVKIGFGSTWGAVTIQVPTHAMPHVKILTTSGDIDVQDVELTDLDVTTTSGDFIIDLDEDQRVERLDLRTTSGDMDITAFADRLNATSVSGDVEIEGQVDELFVNTVSGDIKVRADVRNISFKAVSGDVGLDFDSDEIREVNGSTVSGDIDIYLPDGIGTMAIHTQTRSGDCTTRCHTNGVGPTVTGHVSSMSGDITIR